jgi:ubiquinone biosynthesis protein UbiJ
MLERGAAAGLNHVLSQHPWAQQRLAPFAGKCVRLSCPPFPDLAFEILLPGLLGETAAGASAALIVTLRPAILPFILSRDEAALEQVRMEGSAELAETVQFLLRHLSWDIEEDLSKVFGDVLAHRMVATGEAFFGWQREAATRLGENFAEYWKEERPLLARPADVAAFCRDVDALRDEVDRLEKRLEILERPIADPR